MADIVIPNHYSAKLSELDLSMIVHVPPGGNWKNIPLTIPSRRLEQIRTSFAEGGGSRSTYYGRLKAGEPSYTITTYFNRPGNGCFAHYDFEGGQHRLISQREAARLQSFPDHFVFASTKGSIFKQIGNAVPPLLAFQIASVIPGKGQFVDLFCGAGGLALGFHWAGWEGIVANDIENGFLETHARNIDIPTVPGDVTDEKVFQEIVGISRQKRAANAPLIVLGGPPCQGFSTAGKSRSMDDLRNHLFKAYAKTLVALQPGYFIFENVPGLLNMQGGAVLNEIKRTLAGAGYTIETWKLNAERYAIPQRRQRVFLVGTRHGETALRQPIQITCYRPNDDLFGSCPLVGGVRDALEDLPPLMAGEDGSTMNYLGTASSPYQRFLRNQLSPGDYLSVIGNGVTR